MPLVGLGTWKLKQPNLTSVLERGIELGYRHVDCAAIYESEEEVGKTLNGIFANPSRFKVKREDVSHQYIMVLSLILGD